MKVGSSYDAAPFLPSEALTGTRPFSIEAPAETPTQGKETVSFGSIFGSFIDETAKQGHESGRMKEAVARGALDDLHGTMITSKEAEISLRLVSSVRNKLLDAFHELWRTSV